MINTYSFKMKNPKRWVNSFIKVEAEDSKEAKKLILEYLAKINKRFVQVYVVSPEELNKIAKEETLNEKGEKYA
tara:strand:- start:144 stop:365 length:222 start_codon:yes stop_codon:yes gene_type:complete